MGTPLTTAEALKPRRIVVSQKKVPLLELQAGDRLVIRPPFGTFKTDADDFATRWDNGGTLILPQTWELEIIRDVNQRAH